MRVKNLFSVLTVATTAGCYSLDVVDVVELRKTYPRFEITADDTPADAETVEAMSIQQDGFYLFGYVPIASVSLEDCFEALVQEARRKSADGISNVKFDILPPSFLKFSVFPLPDWTATVVVTGTAYRRHRDESWPREPARHRDFERWMDRDLKEPDFPGAPGRPPGSR